MSQPTIPEPTREFDISILTDKEMLRAQIGLIQEQQSRIRSFEEAIENLIVAHNSVIRNFMDQTAHDQWQAACLAARQAAKGE